MSKVDAATAAKGNLELIKNLIGILIIVGVALYLFTANPESPGFLVWLLAIIVAAVFFAKAGTFLNTLSDNDLNTLGTIMYAFIGTWILAAALDVAYWEDIYASTLSGIAFSLVGTALMFQFRNTGKTIARTAPVMRMTAPRGATTITASPTVAAHCMGCGASLQNLQPGQNFCPNCGRKIA